MPDFPKELIEEFNRKWEEFCAVSKDTGPTLSAHKKIFGTFQRVMVFSDFVARNCIRKPEMFDGLIRSGDLEQKYAKNEYRRKLKKALAAAANDLTPENSRFQHSSSGNQHNISQLQQILRHVRNREMVRIAWRDLAGWADLTETMTDLSDFADACLEETLSLLYAWEGAKLGIPLGKDGSSQYLVILGMGKLGARELNFSSDVDLIFAYPEAGVTSDGEESVTNDEFFFRLGRRLINVIGAKTPDGIVFRVDMGLRPHGKNGPLVMSFDSLETYYQSQGREWERYAWIKARVVAGDKKQGAALLERLKPFVYRRYLDYGTFETLRDMKQKISLEVNRKGMQENVKLGPGGIREIEFFGQVFQLLRGGVIAPLQERRIQTVLKILAGENLIPPHVCDELTAAYVFLRNTEHRLQEYVDRQTHALPKDAVGKARLSASMGFSEWESFLTALNGHMGNVHRHFRELLETEPSEDKDDVEKETDTALMGIWQNLIDSEEAKTILANAGFNRPDDAILQLEALRREVGTLNMGPHGRNRIDKLIPMLLKTVGASENSDIVLIRLLRLVSSITTRTCYMSLLLENPSALVHLIKLANASPWIATFLTHHPALLDELLDPSILYVPPGRAELERDLRRRLANLLGPDLEDQMEVLRIFKQINTLHVAAADISGDLPLMRVSDYLSYIAETILQEILELSWRHLVEKHGRPVCRLDGRDVERGFAVIAYGKLGGLELSYSSDLDLVFLHAGVPGQTVGGPKPIDNAHFFARLGQRVIHLLSAHTSAGILYEVDMRLRPSGSSGVLVSQIDSFYEYQAKQAWTWEHQALVRARPVCGDPLLTMRFEEIRKKALAQYRPREKLLEDVSEMRERLRREHLSKRTGIFDLDQGIGGIVDIEFLVQYLVLLKSSENFGLLRWTDNVRQLQELSGAGILDNYTAYLLRGAYLTYRAVRHRLSLQEKLPYVEEIEFRDLRQKVKEVWDYYLTRS
ncbi:bifunctional [glutamate--ammonia ligase]-adenylyl-L-tyrosine phosphorylase/[glutamate--ammonia-ligase] adenylyltransferase [Thermodesulfobacteriota bacterium]